MHFSLTVDIHVLVRHTANLKTDLKMPGVSGTFSAVSDVNTVKYQPSVWM